MGDGAALAGSLWPGALPGNCLKGRGDRRTRLKHSRTGLSLRHHRVGSSKSTSTESRTCRQGCGEPKATREVLSRVSWFRVLFATHLSARSDCRGQRDLAKAKYKVSLTVLLLQNKRQTTAFSHRFLSPPQHLLTPSCCEGRLPSGFTLFLV